MIVHCTIGHSSKRYKRFKVGGYETGEILRVHFGEPADRNSGEVEIYTARKRLMHRRSLRGAAESVFISTAN